MPGLLSDSISLEAIDAQIDDSAISAIADHFENIKQLISFYRINRGITAFKNKKIKKEFEAIDKLLFKRIKLKFQHVYSDTFYAVLPIKFDKAYAIDEHSKEIIDILRDYEKQCESESGCNNELKNEDIINADNYSQIQSIIRKTLNNVRDLEKSLGGNGLKVDFEKAEITGLRQEEPIFVMCDPVLLLSVLDLSAREATAILLHEIGHAFTYISTGYKDVKQTTLLTESFLETTSKEDRIKKMSMVSEKYTGKSLDGSKNDAQVFVDMTRAILEEANANNVLPATDSEQLADQFSARFGLGKELVTALDKIGDLYADYAAGYNAFIVILAAYEVLLLLIMGISLAVISLVVAIGMLVYLLTNMAIALLGSEDTAETTYDSNVDRIRRIKQDMIRQIRTAQIPKKYMKKYIDDIEAITAIVTKYKDEKGFLSMIGDIAPWNIDKYVTTRVQKLIENTSENDLHVSKNKLELLI